MDDPVPTCESDTRIEMVEGRGEWFVHVVEDGQEQAMQFDLESFALAFAEGQRIRLKLAEIVRK
jgi:hypothetical protein